MAGLLSPQAGGFFATPRIGNLITSADVLRSRKPGSYLNGSISSYSPSVLDRAEQKITGLLSYVMPRKEAARLAHKATSFANDFTPAGDAVTAAQAGADFRQGNVLSGLGNTALAAIGVVPGVGDVAAKGIRKGIRAYHGSPYDFEKFSLDRVGSGEGAQAQGHGLYFTESQRLASAYRKANPMRDFGPGHLYEVGINANRSDFLDWERNLGDLPGHVRERAREAMGDFVPPDITGARLYAEAKRKLGSDVAASRALRDAGIPGVTYSTGPGGRQSNFVIFDDSIIDILNKY